MPWIESHQKLRDHPKLLHLINLTGWSREFAIGKLHLFWWWCVDYAEDGDLRKYNYDQITSAIVSNGEDGKIIIKALIESFWIDEKPYFRVHDWWDFFGHFLKTKYRHNPKKWKRIQGLYKSQYRNRMTLSKTLSKTLSLTLIPNLPNLTINKEKETDKEKENYIVSTTAVSTSPPSNKFPENAREILTFLNAKAGRRYPSSKVNLDFIICRLKEGASVAQCRQIIAKKCREWSTDEKMKNYLRPATLFNRTKFNQYVGELIPDSEENNENNEIDS